MERASAGGKRRRGVSFLNIIGIYVGRSSRYFSMPRSEGKNVPVGAIKETKVNSTAVYCTLENLALWT